MLAFYVVSFLAYYVKKTVPWREFKKVSTLRWISPLGTASAMGFPPKNVWSG